MGEAEIVTNTTDVSLQSVGNLSAPTASDIEGPTDLDGVSLCFETEISRCPLRGRGGGITYVEGSSTPPGGLIQLRPREAAAYDAKTPSVRAAGLRLWQSVQMGDRRCSCDCPRAALGDAVRTHLPGAPMTNPPRPTLMAVLDAGRLVSRTLFFSYRSRTTICRTHSFEIPTASPIALSVAPAFRAFAIALLRLDPARNLLLHSGDHRALDPRALFRACGSPGTRLFLLRVYEGYVSVAPLRRCNRPSTAPRLVPSFSAIFAAENPSASSQRNRSSRSGVQKLPDIRRIFLMRRPLPSAPILAITAAHATTKHLTSNHHDNDGSTPPFHCTAGQRLPVRVRRTPPWE